jgi:multisubunit Na+/H+ antiporter MnhB subunit
MSFQGGLIFGIAFCLMFAGMLLSGMHSHNLYWLMVALGAGVSGLVVGVAAGLRADEQDDILHHRKK